MRNNTLRYLSGSCALIAWLFASYAAHAAPSKEYLVKAAFIYNFTKFVSWSNNPQTINICMNGTNHFGGALKKIEKRSNTKKTYKVYNSAAAKNDCHLSIYSSTPSKIETKTNLLTIGDSDSFTDNGGIISFITKGSKVKFIINLKVAKAAGLKMNPQLLEIADKVIR